MDKRFKPADPAHQLAERIALIDELHALSQAGELISSAGVAKAVKLIRERLRITAAEMSKISGVAVRSITQIEAGKGNPTLATIEALLSPLGLKVSVITNPKNPTAQPPNR